MNPSNIFPSTTIPHFSVMHAVHKSWRQNSYLDAESVNDLLKKPAKDAQLELTGSLHFHAFRKLFMTTRARVYAPALWLPQVIKPRRLKTGADVI